ncbi:MAG: hypothetical protein KC964_03135, partial [Candidatus Omnitrophica bacterium]|nr:hypothetical protein [Candidatus Omnitrophota bacterium]
MDATEFNEVLTLYSKIQHPRLELILKKRQDESPHRSHSPKKVVDWKLLLQSNTGNPDFDPALVVIKLTVFTNGGNINWDDVVIPNSLIVSDERSEPVQPESTFGMPTSETAQGDAQPPLLEEGWG